jgi:hypothetical protein
MNRLYKIACGSPTGPQNMFLRNSTILVNLNTITHVELIGTRLTINFNSIRPSGSAIFFSSDPQRLDLKYKDVADATAEFTAIEKHMSELR